MYADGINPQMEMTVKSSVRGAVAIVMPITPAPETKAAYHEVSPPDSKRNTKSIIGANRHAVVLSPDAISEHHRSTSHSTTASPEWPRRRPSETSRHRTAKSRLRDGYACYGSRHGARGSHVGGGSGTEAEIAPIRHFSCLDFASALSLIHI